MSRHVQKQNYGKFLSHILLDWTEIFSDKLLIEKMADLKYQVASNKVRLFRFRNIDVA